MISVFKGHTTSEAVSNQMGRDAVIEYLIITNRSGAPVAINLLVRAVDDVHVCPLNLRLDTDESYTDRKLAVLGSDRIVVQATALVDFYFSILTDGDYSQKR